MRSIVVAKMIGLLLLGLYLVMGLAQPTGNNTDGGNSDGATVENVTASEAPWAKARGELF